MNALRDCIKLSATLLLAVSFVAPARAQITARITNLSIRTTAGAGNQTLIAGVTVGGAGSLPLLVRGIGPGLLAFNVTDALADPRMFIFSGQTQIASNDDWGGTAQLTQLAQQVGAFPLSAGSKDAALTSAFATGGYSVVVGGPGSTTGIALAEIYDATPSTGTATARLINCSARAQVGTGSGILIAGFSISGGGTKKILVRGVGPGLAQFGVTGVLADPLLAIFSGTTLLANNDDWDRVDSATPELTAAFAQVGAFALPAKAGDAALVISLGPGSYTAQVSGFAAGTGVGLVEIYELP